MVQPHNIEAAVSPRCKAIVIVKPQNPTGAVTVRPTAEKIDAIALCHEPIIISSEFYEHLALIYALVKAKTALPEMRQRTVTADVISKTYSMSGMAVDYLAAPADFSTAAVELRHMLSICASTMSQKAPLPHKRLGACVHNTLATYAVRRNFMIDDLNKLSIPSNRPKGAFFVFVDIQAPRPSFDFCVRLLPEEQVQVFQETSTAQVEKGLCALPT